MDYQEQIRWLQISLILSFWASAAMYWSVDTNRSRLQRLRTPSGPSEILVVFVRHVANFIAGSANIARLADNTGMILRMSRWSTRRQRQQLFDTDILFLDKNYIVISAHSVNQEKPETLRESRATYVLVLNAGDAAKHGLVPGSRLT